MLVPYETRFYLYKLRNSDEFDRLRTEIIHHPRADFSIRSFDRLKCVFVHSTKSAGTSIALSLFGELPYHYTAQQYRVIFGRRDFGNYFKFGFVRNPWDRLYSAYSYLSGGGWDDHDKIWRDINLGQIADFEEFVLDWLTPERLYSHIHFWPQTRFLCDRSDRILLDHLGYFETLKSDYEVIRERIGAGAALQHTNQSPRTSYKDVYTPRLISKVYHLYARDICIFGYRFDEIKKKYVRNSVLVNR
jgi:hypothetical protein